MQKTDATENRTEKILKLKESEQKNKNRMNTVSDIMGYAKYRGDKFAGKLAVRESQGNDEYFAEDAGEENQTKEWKSTFKFRLIFCVLLFGVILSDRFWFHKIPPTVYEDAESKIRCDYSGGIIDFINELPYTLEYEETGVTR